MILILETLVATVFYTLSHIVNERCICDKITAKIFLYKQKYNTINWKFQQFYLKFFPLDGLPGKNPAMTANIQRKFFAADL